MDQPAEPLRTLLHRLASRYIWWKSPEDALLYPDRIIAQVMDIGDFQEMEELAQLVGDDRLRAVLAYAQAGQFRPRSWHYWHHRLGLAASGGVPPLPARKLG
jgi:hypothetical protein